jgi:NTE family protein
MHMGVLRALDEAGIRANVVTGSSAGSIAAALYASAMPIADMATRINAVSEWQIADLVLSKQGAIQGQALAAWVDDAVGRRAIQALPIPLGIAVTDLSTGQSQLIVQGNVGQAVQASSSIPGAFVPVMHKESVWVDGAILSMVPVRFARQLGAEVVIGIDIYCGKTPVIKPTALNTAYSSFRLQNCKLSEAEMAEADVLIRPLFEPAEVRSFKQRNEAIEAGYLAAKAALPEIFKRLNRASAQAVSELH